MIIYKLEICIIFDVLNVTGVPAGKKSRNEHSMTIILKVIRNTCSWLEYSDLQLVPFGRGLHKVERQLGLGICLLTARKLKGVKNIFDNVSGYCGFCF